MNKNNGCEELPIPLRLSFNSYLGNDNDSKFERLNDKYILLASQKVTVFDSSNEIIFTDFNVIDMCTMNDVFLSISQAGDLKFHYFEQRPMDSISPISIGVESSNFKLCASNNTIAVFSESCIYIYLLDGFHVVNNATIKLPNSTFQVTKGIDKCSLWGTFDNVFAAASFKGSNFLLCSLNFDGNEINSDVMVKETKYWITAMTNQSHDRNSGLIHATGDCNGSIVVWKIYNSTTVEKVITSSHFCQSIVTSLFMCEDNTHLWIGDATGVIVGVQLSYDKNYLIKIYNIALHINPSFSNYLSWRSEGQTAVVHGTKGVIGKTKNNGGISSGFLTSICFHDGVCITTYISDMISSVIAHTSPFFAPVADMHSNRHESVVTKSQRHMSVVSTCLYISELRVVVTSAIDHTISIWDIISGKNFLSFPIGDGVNGHVTAMGYYIILQLKDGIGHTNLEDSACIKIMLLLGYTSGRVIEVLLTVDNFDPTFSYLTGDGKAKDVNSFTALDILESESVSDSVLATSFVVIDAEISTNSENHISERVNGICSDMWTYKIFAEPFASTCFTPPHLPVTEIFTSLKHNVVCISYAKYVLYVHSILTNKPVIEIDFNIDDEILDLNQAVSKFSAKSFQKIDDSFQQSAVRLSPSNMANSKSYISGTFASTVHDHDVQSNVISCEDVLDLLVLGRRELKVIDAVRGRICYTMNIQHALNEYGYTDFSKLNTTSCMEQYHQLVISFCAVTLTRTEAESHSNSNMNSSVRKFNKSSSDASLYKSSLKKKSNISSKYLFPRSVKGASAKEGSRTASGSACHRDVYSVSVTGVVVSHDNKVFVFDTCESDISSTVKLYRFGMIRLMCDIKLIDVQQDRLVTSVNIYRDIWLCSAEDYYILVTTMNSVILIYSSDISDIANTVDFKTLQDTTSNVAPAPSLASRKILEYEVNEPFIRILTCVPVDTGNRKKEGKLYIALSNGLSFLLSTT